MKFPPAIASHSARTASSLFVSLRFVKGRLAWRRRAVAHPGRWVRRLAAGLVCVGVAATDASLLARQPKPQKVLEELKECKEPLSAKRQQELSEGLSRLTVADLDALLAVASGPGAPTCRGLAIAATGGIAAKDPNVGPKVIQAVVPYLSDPVLGQAPIHAILPMGVAANTTLISLLDKQDRATWRGLVVILQNINNTRLPAGSELRSPPSDSAEGRARVSAQWARWWRDTGQGR